MTRKTVKKTAAQKKRDYKRGGKKLKKEVKKGKRQAKIGKVMEEYKEGKLHSGSKHGPLVRSLKQALAIALSEASKIGKKPKKRKKKASK